MSDIRSIKIMGPAKDDYLKTGTRRRKKQAGGYDAPPPAPASAGDLAPNPVASLPATFQSSTPSSGGAKVHPLQEKTHPVQERAQEQHGGKLVLLERKKKSSVILTRKDPRKKLSGQIGQTRKLRIHMGHLRTRMTRAKDINKRSEREDIGKVVETLVGAGLIKGGGKPSEERTNILRGIYRDYLQLRSNAL
jgi:hypothetical protein